MNKRVLALFFVALLITAHVEVSAEMPLPYSNCVAYLAGVESLAANKSLSRRQLASRYRRLREITGINGAKAKAFVLGYKNDPAGWQKVRAAVLDTLQKKGS
jgi:hypothetical protein